MNLEQLKNECPKMPDQIKAMIEQEVETRVNGPAEVYPKRKLAAASWKRTLAAALIAVMAFSTIAFAGVKLYQWSVEKEGKYGLKAGVITGGEKVPEYLPVLSIKAGWLPDGMVQNPGGSSKYSYKSTPFEGGFSLDAIAMDKSLSEDRLPVSDTDVTASEMVKIQGHDGIYIEKSKGAFDKKVYISYPEQWQIIEVFAGKDMTKAQTLKFVQNLKVTPTDKKEPLSGMWTWSRLMKPETEDAGMKFFASDKEMKTLHQVGDKFTVDTAASVDGEVITAQNLQAQVTDIQVLDNLSGLNPEYVDADLRKIADSEGSLTENNIRYIQSGDGINTLDREIKSVKMPRKIVKAAVKFTNTGKETLEDVCFFGSFVGLVKTEGGYRFYNRALDDADENTDAANADSIGGFGAMDYYDIHREGDDKNYIPSIKPGQTVTVNIAKVVNEDELDKLFLSLDTQGAECEFTGHALDIGYVDIRQQTAESK